MTEAAVQALDTRVSRLEQEVSAGLKRIEDLLQREIHELKVEQIKDIKEEGRRIADDQRRLWDAVRELEKRESQRYGSDKRLGSIWILISAIMGGFASWFANMLAVGRPPHP